MTSRLAPPLDIYISIKINLISGLEAVALGRQQVRFGQPAVGLAVNPRVDLIRAMARINLYPQTHARVTESIIAHSFHAQCHLQGPCAIAFLPALAEPQPGRN